jgi:hypothetical protein
MQRLVAILGSACKYQRYAIRQKSDSTEESDFCTLFPRAAIRLSRGDQWVTACALWLRSPRSVYFVYVGYSDICSSIYAQ